MDQGCVLFNNPLCVHFRIHTIGFITPACNTITSRRPHLKNLQKSPPELPGASRL